MCYLELLKTSSELMRKMDTVQKPSYANYTLKRMTGNNFEFAVNMNIYVLH